MRTSRTSQVLTVTSLQRLKMEALIPAPAGCEVCSVIKFLNAQSIALIRIHHQLCQIMAGYTWLESQHISCWSLVGACLIIIHRLSESRLHMEIYFIYTFESIFSGTVKARFYYLVQHTGPYRPNYSTVR